jgi:hypothetical protein
LASAGPLTSFAITTNSSPPSLPTVSPRRVLPRSRAPMICRTLSPTPWPSESLIVLNLSTSMNSTAVEPGRFARSSGLSRSIATVRLNRPVSASWVASYSRLPSIILRSVMSVIDTTTAAGSSPSGLSARHDIESHTRLPSGRTEHTISPLRG